MFYPHIPRLADFIRTLARRFPDTSTAAPIGLLCQGGSLSLQFLLAAYSRGIFPWFNEGEPILWWTPDPRCILLPENYHLPRRSARYLRKAGFRLSLDRAFTRVIKACANRDRTWLTEELQLAFINLHEAGFAHSVEAWHGDRLVGGLYGMAMGRAFFGESMFHTESMASRAALAGLADLLRLRGVTLLDCQQETSHVMAQGAMLVPRTDFEERLAGALTWQEDGTDALSLEYRNVPQAAQLWPFLPWRTHYRHVDGHWQPADAENPADLDGDGPAGDPDRAAGRSGEQREEA